MDLSEVISRYGRKQDNGEPTLATALVRLTTKVIGEVEAKPFTLEERVEALELAAAGEVYWLLSMFIGLAGDSYEWTDQLKEDSLAGMMATVDLIRYAAMDEILEKRDGGGKQT